MICIRNVTKNDANLLQNLANSCKPLDVHTIYTYWVLCNYFNNICYILEIDTKPIVFITAVQSSKILIWQIGILPEYRGNGYSLKLIDAVISNINDTEDIRVTIDKNNDANNGAFKKYASVNNYEIRAVDSLKLKGIDIEEDEIIYNIFKKE